MTSGCSMGGGGSVNIGMFNSDLFSGVISFYGAIRMVENGYTAAAQTPDGYLNQFSVFLACGNQDMYAFMMIRTVKPRADRKRSGAFPSDRCGRT